MLETRELRFRVGGSEILTGVDLSVFRGERLGIIGPNGSGKTTLFNCLSGFHYPTGGRILLEGRDITRLAPHRRAALGLGRVFQSFGIFKEMTVLENMLTAIESREPFRLLTGRARRRQLTAEALAALERVGLAERADEKAGSLSGGQMRLLEIARVMAFGASVLLLDEPTAGVSPKMKGQITEALGMLLDGDRTLLIIEHDLNFIEQLCDRIVVLDVGRVVLDGSPEAIRNNAMLHEIYFGSNGGAPGREARSAARAGAAPA